MVAIAFGPAASLFAYQESKTINSELQLEFLPGSHLVVNMGLYDHHGIYCGDGKVIHFGRGIFDLEHAVVELVDLEVFSKGRTISHRDSKSNYDSEQIVDRAHQRIGESGYDLIDNNCEHFANWCRSGEHESHQVNLSETFARQTAAVAAKTLFQKWAVKISSRQTIRAVAIGVAKGPAIVAGVADLVQATVEIVAVRNGKSKSQTRHIGQQVGFASAAAIGWTLGGPVTAAAGVGYWVVGQVVANQTVETGKLVVAAVTGIRTKLPDSGTPPI